MTRRYLMDPQLLSAKQLTWFERTVNDAFAAKGVHGAIAGLRDAHRIFTQYRDTADPVRLLQAISQKTNPSLLNPKRTAGTKFRRFLLNAFGRPGVVSGAMDSIANVIISQPTLDTTRRYDKFVNAANKYTSLRSEWLWSGLEAKNKRMLRSSLEYMRKFYKEIQGTTADVEASTHTLNRTIGNVSPELTFFMMGTESGNNGIRVLSTGGIREMMPKADEKLLRDAWLGEYVDRMFASQDARRHGSDIQIGDIAWADIQKKLDSANKGLDATERSELSETFKNYAQQKASLERAKLGRDQPFLETIGIEAMENTLKKVEAKHPEFAEAADMVRKYFDGLLIMEYLAGEKTAAEVKVITEK